MKTLNIVNGPQNVSAIVQGCMWMTDLSNEAATEVIKAAYDAGALLSLTMRLATGKMVLWSVVLEKLLS